MFFVRVTISVLTRSSTTISSVTCSLVPRLRFRRGHAGQVRLRYSEWITLCCESLYVSLCMNMNNSCHVSWWRWPLVVSEDNRWTVREFVYVLFLDVGPSFFKRGVCEGHTCCGDLQEWSAWADKKPWTESCLDFIGKQWGGVRRSVYEYTSISTVYLYLVFDHPVLSWWVFSCSVHMVAALSLDSEWCFHWLVMM